MPMKNERADKYAASQKVKPSVRTVCVACKIPTGMRLMLQTPQPTIVDSPQGPKEVNFNVPGGQAYFVYGPAYPVSPPPDYPPPPMIVGGYAITPGIPADHWNEWVEQNKLASYFLPPDGAEKGMIFAYPTLASTQSAAKESAKMLSGLEPLSQDKDKDGRLTDPRVPRPLNASLRPLQREPHPNEGPTSIGGGDSAAA